MKRIICILLILSLFVITSSCAKKGDEKDKYVEFDKSTQASQQVDTDKTQASDSEPDFEIKEPEQSQANTEDKSHTDNNPINKPDTDVTDGKNIEALFFVQGIVITLRQYIGQLFDVVMLCLGLCSPGCTKNFAVLYGNIDLIDRIRHKKVCRSPDNEKVTVL